MHATVLSKSVLCESALSVEIHTTILSIFHAGDSSCVVNLDLVFLLDGSRSIELDGGKGNFRQELNFTKQVIDAFRVGEGRVRASVIVYSTQPLLIFGLDKYNGKQQKFKAIDAVQFPAAGSDLGKALHLVQRQSFNYSIPSTTRTLVILTDGRAKDEIEQPAKELASKGVQFLMVGVGDNADRNQLEEIASEPKEESVFDFEMLPKLVDRISRDLCVGIGKDILDMTINLHLKQVKQP